jgi:phosphoenolpyruvate carboxykinase (ATP)
MIQAVLSGALNDVPTTPDLAFGIAVPRVCPNVPAEVLNPRSTWADTAGAERGVARAWRWQA